MARRRRPARLSGKAARLVEWERVARVATVSASGTPHVVPVCHILAGAKLYFGSGRRARKIRNLRANPRVTLTVDLYTDAWDALKGVMVQGTATIIEKGPRFRRLRARIYRKYPQYPSDAALGESDSVIVEIRPTHAFTWGLD